MRLYGAISKIVPQEDGTVKIEGIASSEAIDDQGETILADAMREAIPDYMKFPALREMHQLSAAGTTLEAEVGSDGCTRIFAHVVDPVAVAKVRTQTYRGFSIGGRVTKRDPGNAKIITGLSLSEISLVDRPANPEAVFDCWKSSTPLEGTEMSGLAKLGETPAGEKLAAALNAPVQIWTCGDPEHRHVAKAEAVQCFEDMAKAAAAEPDPVATESEDPEAAAVEEAAKAAAVAEPDAQLGAQETLDAAREALERSKRALEEPVEEDPAKSAADPATAEVTAEVDPAADDAAKADKPKGDYGDVEYADPGLQDDKKPRYPIDTEAHIRAAWNYINQEKNCAKYSSGGCAKVKAKIVAAWKEKIDKDGPPSASEKMTPAEDLSKSLYTVQELSGVIMFLDNMCEDLKWEAMLEGDNSGAPAEAKALLAAACAFLRSQVQEETAEIMAGTDIDYDDSMMMASVGATLQKMAALTLELGSAENPGQFDELSEALIKAGSKHSANDQMLLDTAYECCTKAMGMDGCTKAQGANLGAAQTEMAAVGGKGWSGDDADKAGGLAMAMDLVIQKAGSHTALACVAHDCLENMTNKAVCGEAAKSGSRHSKETLAHLTKAHDSLCAAGAKCDAAKASESEDTKVTSSETDDLAKLRRDNEALTAEVESERTQKAAFNALLSEIMPTLDRLTKKVEAIAETPIAPMAVVRVDGGVTKASDGSSTAPSSLGFQDLSPDQVTAALSKMSKEDQTLALIKASYANPRELRSLGGVPRPFTAPTN